MSRFQVTGTEKLIGALKENADLDLVKKTIRLNATEMQKKAMRKAPVRTGDLRRAIKLRMADGGFTALVRSEIEYAPYQEYGTRFMTGTPHIRPAFHEQSKQFKKDMSRLMK